MVTAATALVGCSSGDKRDVAAEDTVAPIDDDPSSTSVDDPVAEDPATEAERAIADKYDIDVEDVRMALNEMMRVAWDPGTPTRPADEVAEDIKAIFDKYDIDAEDFAKAYRDMLAAGAGSMPG